jgi:hypothetical protein
VGGDLAGPGLPRVREVLAVEDQEGLRLESGHFGEDVAITQTDLPPCGPGTFSTRQARVRGAAARRAR